MGLRQYDKSEFRIKLDLTAYFGASVQKVELDTGEVEECVCIPIDRNELKRTRRGRIISLMYMYECRFSEKCVWSHYLKMKVTKKFVDLIKKMGYTMPFMGNARKHDFQRYKEVFDKKRIELLDGYDKL